MILISVRKITSYQSEFKQSFYFHTSGQNDTTNSLCTRNLKKAGPKRKGNMQLKLRKHIPTSFDHKFLPNTNLT